MRKTGTQGRDGQRGIGPGLGKGRGMSRKKREYLLYVRYFVLYILILLFNN